MVAVSLARTRARHDALPRRDALDDQHSKPEGDVQDVARFATIALITPLSPGLMITPDFADDDTIVDLTLAGGADYSSDNEGADNHALGLIDLGLIFSHALGGVTWCSQDYLDTVLGIDTAKAAASGLYEADVDAGFKNAGVQAVGNL